MIIKGCRTIQEYKEEQNKRIQKWIDETFLHGSVEWERKGASHILITDKKGDSVEIALDDIP